MEARYEVAVVPFDEERQRQPQHVGEQARRHGEVESALNVHEQQRARDFGHKPEQGYDSEADGEQDQQPVIAARNDLIDRNL